MFCKFSFALLSAALIGLSAPAFAESGEHAAPKESAPSGEHAAVPKEHGAPGGAASHEVHWTYECMNGPEHWGEVKPEFKACQSGMSQSPIDLKSTIRADLPAITIDYKPAPLTVLNNGHTIQVNYPEGSTMTVDGQVFNLLQLHFHTPSEYAIEGKRYDMEVHLVHKNAAGELGVIGIMAEKGKENPAVEKIWSHLPEAGGAPQTSDKVTINASDFLPENKSYYRLMGSLTTPPCSEGVHWHVMKTPIQFSAAQIDKFKTIFPMNARPLQASNGRLIVLDR
ncbi:MAG: carbonic anhydrase family protein [Pseudomonadota bacterium]